MILNTVLDNASVTEKRLHCLNAMIHKDFIKKRIFYYNKLKVNHKYSYFITTDLHLLTNIIIVVTDFSINSEDFSYLYIKFFYLVKYITAYCYLNCINSFVEKNLIYRLIFLILFT